MVTIESLIPKGAILIDPPVRSKQELLQAMVASLSECKDLIDGTILYKDVMARESLAPTYLGFGCAIPHAHSSAIKGSHVALALLTKGIDFNEASAEQANIVFLLVGPPDNPSLHLKLLSKIARFLHDADFRNLLIQSATPEEVLKLLSQKEGQ